MKLKLYGIMSDYGDGSCGVTFYPTKEGRDEAYGKPEQDPDDDVYWEDGLRIEEEVEVVEVNGELRLATKFRVASE